MLVPALQKHIDVEVVSSQRATRNAQRIYQLGNNPHHAWIYDEAMRVPGVIVLHDIVLHHLIVEMTLARGDVEGYVDALRANHGEAGAAWARGRAAGLHSEMGNFLLPASVEVANRSTAVIVHNRWAADRLRSHGVTTPIHVVPHPYEPQPDARSRRAEIRAKHGIAPDERVIGFFGFLTSAKRAEVVLAAAEKAGVRLLIVGEAAPNIDVATTGYVDEADFGAYFAAVDRLVNLRYPSAGETSGTLIRAFEAGKPVAVSDYAQFAEYPDDCVVKIPFGEHEVHALADFFVRELPDPSASQRRWLDQNADMEKTVAGYLQALQEPNVGRASARRREGDGLKPVLHLLPLFPRLEATLRADRIVLKNAGDVTLRTRTYGQPAYRLIVNGLWRELPRDLPPGEETEIAAPAERPIALIHAMQGIPLVDAQPFAVLS